MIEIKNLSKKYEKNGIIVSALDNVTLNLPDKGMVLLIGKNGSGKTTFLNMLGLIDEPDSGSIFINGQDILNFNSRERDIFRANNVSYIFQNVNLIDSFTAKENLLVVKDDEKEANDALVEMELESCGKKFPSQMSQGQIQKVAIIRAMMNDTSIILADEPTAALDVSMRDSVVAQLKKASQKKLVIVVTHNTDLFWDADMVARFEDGKVEFESIRGDREIEDIDSEKTADDVDKYNPIYNSKSIKVKPKLAILFGLRNIKHSLISSIVFVIFAMISFTSFTLLLGCPQSSMTSYMFGNVKSNNQIIAKIYDQNDNDYVIVSSYENLREKGAAFSKFNNVTFQEDYDIDDATSLWHIVAKRRNYRFSSNITNQSILKNKQLVSGRLAQHGKEIVITDYLADCLIERGAEGKKYINYDDILSNGHITLEFENLRIESKIVGIVSTDCAKYSNLKNHTLSVLSHRMRHWDSMDDFIAETELEGEFSSFIYKFDYSYGLCYCDGSLDKEIAKLSQSMNVGASFNQENYSKLCSTVDKDTNMNLNDIYPAGEGDAIVSLSVFPEILGIINEGISQGKTSKQIIQEYVNTLSSASVEIYGEKYSVGAYYDDLDIDDNDGRIYLPPEIAEEIYNKKLSEDVLSTYAIIAKGEDLEELSNKYGSIFFAEYFIALHSTEKYGLTSFVLTILSIGLLLLTAVYIISDIIIYCKSYAKQLAIMHCIGINNSSVAFTAFIKYLILLLFSYALSFSISLPLLFKLSDIVTAPYKLSGFITFSPWSILISIAYICVIFAIAYIFGLNNIKKRSLVALLR